MGANQEIRKDTAWAGIALLSSAPRIGLERPASNPPNRLVQVKFNAYSCIFKKCIEKSLGSCRSGQEFGEYRGTHHQSSLIQSIVKSRLGGIAHCRIAVPKSDNNVGIQCSCHVPRISLTQRRMAFLPEPIPRFPMPRYLANGLPVLTGRTRTPFLSLSNNSVSPGWTPSTFRIACGTVIWPLVVIFACFSTSLPPISLLQYTPPYFVPIAAIQRFGKAFDATVKGLPATGLGTGKGRRYLNQEGSRRNRNHLLRGLTVVSITDPILVSISRALAALWPSGSSSRYLLRASCVPSGTVSRPCSNLLFPYRAEAFTK